MQNVVEFKAKARSRIAVPEASSTVDAMLPTEPTALIDSLRSKAKRDIQKAVFMLDLALQHAHALASRIADPDVRRTFAAHAQSIELSLEVARSRALDL